jgi:facilitated trehalose transporter
MIGLGTFFYLKEQNDNVLPDGLGWLPLTSLMIFVFAFNFGYGPVPWVFLGEILPSHVKGA